MQNSFLFQWQDLDVDIAFEFCYQLYWFRMAAKKTLTEVTAATGLSLADIDNLETGLGKIDFAKVMLLLDFYNVRLDMCSDCFPGLPEAVGEKYFKY